jgi:hypothetical protein
MYRVHQLTQPSQSLSLCKLLKMDQAGRNRCSADRRMRASHHNRRERLNKLCGSYPVPPPAASERLHRR